MATNRFTKSSQLSEEAFIGLLYDYVLATPVPLCAARTGVSEKSVSKKFIEFGRRAEQDRRLSRDFPQTPPADDPIWSKLKDCIFECPENVEVATLQHKEVQNMYGLEKRSSRKATYSKKLKKSACTNCPFANAIFRIPEGVLEALHMMSANSRKWAKVEEFKYHYIRATLHSAIRRYREDRVLSPTGLVDMFLKSFVENPL